jgi:hypothetical protein
MGDSGGGLQEHVLIWRCLITQLFADAVDEELDAAAAGADVDVEGLAVLEQLEHAAEEVPGSGPLVEILRAAVS